MQDKIFGAILGLCLGDALGVPVEFSSREELRRNPVTDMRGYGTYDLPPGSWSDDSSLTLCLTDSLANGLNFTDIMSKFLAWLDSCAYTPHGQVFDVGAGTRKAILRFARGVAPLHCGGATEHDNGNGALMRILPLLFYLRGEHGHRFFHWPAAYEPLHQLASLTHAHPRSQIACGLYLAVAGMLLNGAPPAEAVSEGLCAAQTYYAARAEFAGELPHYQRLFREDFPELPEASISSSGYVVDTLEAALWCLLGTDSYAACVLRAVNLGEDTDTVAAVAGGLAGLHYGLDNIPAAWLRQLARVDYITGLCRELNLWCELRCQYLL